MWRRAGKRLFILLPAVWLISSAVFMLSRTLPGSAADDIFEQQAQSLNSLAKAEARRAAHRQLLHRTGQDLPVFYFTIGTAAEPDTLYRIFPLYERQALQNLVLKHANWPAISLFYLQWQQLKQQLPFSGLDPEQVRHQLNRLEKLLHQPNKAAARSYFKTLKELTSFTHKAQVEQTENAFFKMVENQNVAANYVPVLHWHGLENQYHKWFRQLLNGHLGYSSRDARPVTEVIAEAFGLTFWLACSALVLVGFLAPEIAMFLSRKSKRSWRAPVLGGLYSLESLPLFIVALLVLSGASATGWMSAFPEQMALGLAMLCLVLVNLPYLVGQSYAALQEVLQQPYLLAARAKGLPENLLLRRHALRNSLLPIITLLSDFFPALLAGSVVLEVIFSLPGMGRLLIVSVMARDFEVVVGLVLLVGLLKMSAHLLADLLYAAADPRLRSASSS